MEQYWIADLTREDLFTGQNVQALRLLAWTPTETPPSISDLLDSFRTMGLEPNRQVVYSLNSVHHAIIQPNVKLPLPKWSDDHLKLWILPIAENP